MLSKDHFTLDGTLLEASASLKSFKPKASNRSDNGSDGDGDPPSGTREEWEAGLEMLEKLPIRAGQTVGADKGYDTGLFVEGCRESRITAHVAAKKSGSSIDGRTTHHTGYEISQSLRKQIEQCFGWMKSFGLLGKLNHRGQDKVDWIFRLTSTAYNITRLKTLI